MYNDLVQYIKILPNTLSSFGTNYPWLENKDCQYIKEYRIGRICYSIMRELKYSRKSDF